MKTPLLLLLLLLLGGCGLFRTQPPADKPLSWQAQREKNRTLEHFQISGKIGIRAPRESGSANLFWQQNQDYFDIRLSGPLGRGAARLVGNLQQARLEAANDISEGKAQTLLSVNLGTGRGHSVLEMVRAFEAASGQTVAHELVARRPGDVAASWADATLAQQLLGWQATRTLEQMCADTWRWVSGKASGQPPGKK